MGSVSPFPSPGQGAGGVGPGQSQQAVFIRAELTHIMGLYGRMVSAGHWRDYAIDHHRDVAIFSAFRRSAERPEFRIEKRPALRNRQGMWTLFSENGVILRRGHELGPLLSPIERRLLKLVGD